MSEPPQSPPKDDQTAQSPDDDGSQDAQLLSPEYEGVKEQDRWLPIANGTLSPTFFAASRAAVSLIPATTNLVLVLACYNAQGSRR